MILFYEGTTNNISNICSGTKNMCAIYNIDTSLFDVYLQDIELKNMFGLIAKDAIKNNNNAIKNIDRFLELFTKLKV